MLKKLKIGGKLMTAFVVVAILAGIGGMVSIPLMNSITTRYGDALVNYGFVQGDIGIVLTELTDSRRCVSDMIHSEDKAYLADVQKHMMDGQTKALGLLGSIEKTLTTDAGRQTFAELQQLIGQYVTVRDEVIELVSSGALNSEQAQLKREQEMDPVYDALYEKIESLMTLKVTTGNELNQTLITTANLSVVVTLVLLIAALLLSSLLGLRIAKGISKPMRACAARLEALARGDLKTVVPVVKTQDETGALASATQTIVTCLQDIIRDETRLLGALADGDLTVRSTADYPGDFTELKRSIDLITDSLSETVSQISGSARQVNVGSQQMSQSAQVLSQGATEQASTIEELSTGINEVSHNVKENAANARQASDKSELVGEKLMESNRQMEMMIKAMGEISSSSDEIQKIIKTIEDIAFQTNILALNAAVEAARAGAAGKGFAVVADEVRNLASKSAEASKNTAALIENSLKAVGNGTKIADDTAQSLLSTVEGAKEVTATILKISKASEEQASVITGITQGMTQVSAVVQNNSASAEESAAVSEELSSQAQVLGSVVGHFKLRDKKDVREKLPAF